MNFFSYIGGKKIGVQKLKQKTKNNFRLNFSALTGNNSKCNLKCFNCHRDYFDVSKEFDESKPISFSDAINFIYEAIGAQNNHFKKIHISGHAEPLIIGQEKFLNEVRQLRNNFPYLPIALTTNGSYLKDIRDEFLAMGNTFINLSLHHLAYLNTKWFNQICDLDDSFKDQVELNIIIDPDIIQNIDLILSFAFSKKISLKFFHRLEEKNPEIVINQFIDLISSKLNGKFVDEVVENNRIKLIVNDGFQISIKLPENFDIRPDACRKCPVKDKCVESCWNSIRITPWYIKPCGVREDNVYLFSENSKENLKNKLKSGGKI